jgi:hypothetical protein
MHTVRRITSVAVLGAAVVIGQFLPPQNQTCALNADLIPPWNSSTMQECFDACLQNSSCIHVNICENNSTTYRCGIGGFTRTYVSRNNMLPAEYNSISDVIHYDLRYYTYDADTKWWTRQRVHTTRGSFLETTPRSSRLSLGSWVSRPATSL